MFRRPELSDFNHGLLDHEEEIDTYLEDTGREFEARGVPMSVSNQALWEKIQRVENSRERVP
jgi:hypothetical protein